MPDNSKDNLVYSPKAIFDFCSKIEPKEGSITYFPKENHKEEEMYFAAIFSLIFYKSSGIKFLIHSNEGPDIDLVTEDQKEGSALEIMTLFEFEKDFDQNYEALSQKVFEKKGIMSYGPCSLLLVSRLKTEFNVTQFAKAMNTKGWKFDRIYLLIYEKPGIYRLGELYPHSNEKDVAIVELTQDEVKKYLY